MSIIKRELKNFIERHSYLNNIPISRGSETKKKDEYPQRADLLTNFIKFPSNAFTKSTNFIYGSYALKTQPYYSDIDTINNVHINLPRRKSIAYIVKMLKHITKKIVDKKGWFFTDMKAGMYDDGSSVHWTPQEVIKGKRNGKMPDFNNHVGEKKLSDAVQENALLKIDMVAPYYGRYIEVTVVYFISDLDGDINFTQMQLDPEYILKSLKEDTRKQFNNHKYFKTAKRIFAQAKAKNDLKVIKALLPLITSNVSKLSSIESDLKTIILLLEERHKLNKVITNEEFNIIIDKLSNVIDISFNEQAIIHALHYANHNIKKHNLINAINALKYIVNYIHSITNNQTMNYVLNHKLTNILNNYI
jgi:hypothetical protein